MLNISCLLNIISVKYKDKWQIIIKKIIVYQIHSVNRIL